MDELWAGILVSHVLEWIKRCKYIPWVSRDTDKLNRIIAIAIAVFSGIGIHFTFDVGTGVFMATGLTKVNMVHCLFDICKQYVAQQGTYKMYIQPKNG